MSAQLIIDVIDFTRNAGVYRGKIAVAALERLQDRLSGNEGELDYVVAGSADADGKLFLHISIDGGICLRCQRCLAGMVRVLAIRTDLLVIRSEGELSCFDENALLDSILAGSGVDVLMLIEDEIILDMPVSPRHPEGKCSIDELYGHNGTVTADNPFSVLKKLQKLH